MPLFDCERERAFYATAAVELAASKEISMTRSEQRPIRAGDKVVRDTTTQDQGKVRLGEGAPVFGR
jgi:hypothetical protein